MSRLLNIFVPILIAALLLAYMCSYTVRFDEVAVKTNFNSVSATNTEPGLYFKVPLIQKERIYPRQVQYMEDLLQEQRTADQIAVVAKLAINWRIDVQDDGAARFYTNVTDIAQAKNNILPLASQLRELISQYRFDELVNTDPDKVKLPELEAAMTERLGQLVAGQVPGAQGTKTDYGIKIERVAITRLELPQSTSALVFNSMKERQGALAEDARAQGRAEADSIIAEAETTKSRILDFARTAAGEIENEGRQDALEYASVFNQNPEFSLLLLQIDGIRQALSGRSTLILQPENLGLDQLNPAATTGNKAPSNATSNP